MKNKIPAFLLLLALFGLTLTGAEAHQNNNFNHNHYRHFHHDRWYYDGGCYSDSGLVIHIDL